VTALSSCSASDADVAAAGWLFLPQNAVPERWRERGVAVVMVPLLPSEARSLLTEGATAQELPGDAELLGLVAAGCTRAAIARKLGVSLRTVQRRLADVQRRTGTASLPELAVLLAKQGFNA
jgi:DNA-binding NarL/FixJ family response regulator